MNNKLKYKYGGAQTLVELHEEEIKLFCLTWKSAKQIGLKLPTTDDPNYNSLEDLMIHVLNWSKRYLEWIVENLELEHSSIESPPKHHEVPNNLDSYVEKLLKWWETPLVNVADHKFYDKTYNAPWKIDYCIDAMLEHAVMHPVRHRKQLEKFIELTKF